MFVYTKGSLWLLDGPAIVDRLQEIPWRHWAVVTAAAVLTLLGLWLLILAFAPASPTVVELRESDPSMSTGITPRRIAPRSGRRRHACRRGERCHRPLQRAARRR